MTKGLFRSVVVCLLLLFLVACGDNGSSVQSEAATTSSGDDASSTNVSAVPAREEVGDDYMDKELFWRIINEAREEAGHWSEMADPLAERLSVFSESDIFLWQQIFYEYDNLSYKSKVWAAAYVINEGCSDDDFAYFRAWLIVQGKDVYMAALKDPETLVNADTSEYAEFEEALDAASDAYFLRLDIEPDYELFYDELDKYPLSESLKAEMLDEIEYASDIDVKWEEDDLDDLLPRLCRKFDW